MISSLLPEVLPVIFSFCTCTSNRNNSLVCKAWYATASQFITKQNFLREYVESRARPFLSMLPEGQGLKECSPEYARLLHMDLLTATIKAATDEIIKKTNVAIVYVYAIKTSGRPEGRMTSIAGKCFAWLRVVDEGHTGLRFYVEKGFSLFPIELFHLKAGKKSQDEKGRDGFEILGHTEKQEPTLLSVNGNLVALTLTVEKGSSLGKKNFAYEKSLKSIGKNEYMCFVPALDAKSPEKT